MRICYVFPSRSRPGKFFKALDNIKELSESDNYFIIAKLDEDDETMNNEEVKGRLQTEYPDVIIRWGLSKNKIHSINRGLEDLPPCDIIIVMSDDMIWEMWGFDTEIRNSFQAHFPDFDGVIHYPDSHALAKTMTLTIIGVNLYNQLGYLYWPEYESVFADNDLTEMTRMMGKYVYIGRRIFDHHHPIWKMSEWDRQYRKTEDKEVCKRDREVYHKRRANKFGL